MARRTAGGSRAARFRPPIEFDRVRYTFDYRAGDVYFCTADCGWITGHSYVTYGPLLNRATQVRFGLTSRRLTRGHLTRGHFDQRP